MLGDTYQSVQVHVGSSPALMFENYVPVVAMKHQSRGIRREAAEKGM